MNKYDIAAQIEDGWHSVLKQEFTKKYFLQLTSILSKEKELYTIYPNSTAVFSAFNLTPFNETKVVIIGQDPYHGPKQAHGLCFSVENNIKHPPSLVNILKEVSREMNTPYPKNGNLEKWAKQGVLLLNTTLTVREGEANSHSTIGWQTFTDKVIKELSLQKSNIIFLLWGGFAKKKIKLIDTSKHYVLTSGHPSPLSANRGFWFGNNHFSKVNEILISLNEKPIDWKID